MTELIIPSEAPALNQLKERKLDRIARRSVLSMLTHLKHGRITIIEGHQRYTFGEKSDTSSLQAEVSVQHSQFYSRILFGGSIGAAEAYMEGLWTADNLTAVWKEAQHASWRSFIGSIILPEKIRKWAVEKTSWPIMTLATNFIHCFSTIP